MKIYSLNILHVHSLLKISLGFLLVAYLHIPYSMTYAEKVDTTYEDQRGDQDIDQATLDQAESLFFKGFALYQQKKYQKATDYFKKAYHLAAHKDLLFNIARSYEQMKNKKESIKWYQAYLATKPIDETSIIHRLKLLGGETKANPIPAKINKRQKFVRSSSNFTFKKIAPWLSIGVGAILMGIGTWSGINALDNSEQARDAKIKKVYNKFKEQAEGDALLADLSIGFGVVAIGVGTYLWYQDYKSNKKVNKNTGVSIGISSQSANIGYAWSF
jgi:tetratricopeptide (TPR) repeat protein